MINVTGILLVSSLVGAAIGGLTNFIAIQMLFRPYHKKNLKLWKLKWDIPFTPGLIPKRQLEIATQLGELVEQHLFTLESIQEKLHLPSFQQELGKWMQKEVEKGLESEKTLNDILTPWVQQDDQQVPCSEKIEQHLAQYVEVKVRKAWEGFEDQQLSGLFSLYGMNIEESVADWAGIILQKSKHFLYSKEGEQMLHQFVQQTIDKQGTFGSMLGMFISKEKIIEKIRPALIDWLDQPLAKEKIQRQLFLMSNVWLEKRVNQVIDVETKEKIISHLTTQIKNNMNVSEWLNQPLHALVTPWKEDILSRVPSMVSQLGEWLHKQIPTIVKQIGISDMVRKQVLSFPLPRLEKMVRDLANKELKMITGLGALLGGVIGTIQALLIIFLFT
jgi:uncharacterized membrane protein YheB (UPF0754 family)